MIKWAPLFIVAIIIGCSFFSKKQGREIIPPDKLVPLLTDIYICDGIITSRTKQNDDNELYDKIFNKHSTNREKLNNTIDYYSDKPDELNKIFEQVVDRLNELQEEINKQEQESMNKEVTEKISKEKLYQFNRKDTLLNSKIQKSQKPERKKDTHNKQKPGRNRNIQKNNLLHSL